jgi:mono/diheme cytochrome c family protein
MKWLALAILLAGCEAAPKAPPPPQPPVPIKIGHGPGAAAFGARCAMCHRGKAMGTVLLARRMKPEIADLENRTDLDLVVVKAVVRGGIGNMPRIPRGEVSDAELDLIARYLADAKQR